MHDNVASLVEVSAVSPCRNALPRLYRTVRGTTEALCAPLSDEDQTIQTMPDVSPAKWHRAHTSWFFETFVLAPFMSDYRIFDPSWGPLFNSYYEQIGKPWPRAQRGLLSRPGAEEIGSYRAAVDEALLRFANQADAKTWAAAAPFILLGLHHEQQHQELILTDIKHVMGNHPLRAGVYPAGAMPDTSGENHAPCGWIDFEGGLCEIGARGEGFAFDSETPRHKMWLDSFRLADRLVTNGEYLSFIEDNGYRRPEFWLSDGWADLHRRPDHAPLYWRQDENGRWLEYTLSGERPLDLAAPVIHVSYYEASAYALWAGKRLPREGEIEAAAAVSTVSGNFGRMLEAGEARAVHPEPAARASNGSPRQLYGDAWEWTMSAYNPYSGFAANAGAIGEYNGKFMCGQYVLKGGSCATPSGHIRSTYRNFFPPDARWQFSGIRLAENG